MTDLRLRQLERAYLESLNPQVHAELIVARVRAGLVSRRDLQVALWVLEHSGLYAAQETERSGPLYEVDEAVRQAGAALALEPPTLAELLAERGYEDVEALAEELLELPAHEIAALRLVGDEGLLVAYAKDAALHAYRRASGSGQQVEDAEAALDRALQAEAAASAVRFSSSGQTKRFQDVRDLVDRVLYLAYRSAEGPYPPWSAPRRSGEGASESRWQAAQLVRYLVGDLPKWERP